MRSAAWSGWLVCAAIGCVALVACGGGSVPPPAAPADDHGDTDAGADDEAPTDYANAPLIPAAPAQPPSTASYDDAMSVPESLDVNDERAHLTDGQLTGPMRGVLNGCRVPSNAKVTIKTAVQNGHAIGVSTNVAFEHPKSVKRISPTTARYETKTAAKIVKCAERAVRTITWPPSRRRDSFTTMF